MLIINVTHIITDFEMFGFGDWSSDWVSNIIPKFRIPAWPNQSAGKNPE